MPDAKFNFNRFVKLPKLTPDQELKWIKSCFNFFKTNQQGINLKSFDRLLTNLFFDYNKSKKEVLFNIFDINQDGFIDFNEFELMWIKWIRIILKPKNALLVVDFQNDFISGSLAIENLHCECHQITSVINDLIKNPNFDIIVYSQDWHPHDHISFFENAQKRQIVKIKRHGDQNWNDYTITEPVKLYDTVIFDSQPKIEQKLWPIHCVQDTWGAALHSDLYIHPNCIRTYKGTNSNIDSYSIFLNNATSEETHLDEKLKALSITDVYICGIAYDVCVSSSACDAIRLNYRTVIIDEACRGIDSQKVEKVKLDLVKKNCAIVSAKRAFAMLSGTRRRFDLGFSLALQIRKASQMYINDQNCQ